MVLNSLNDLFWHIKFAVVFLKSNSSVPNHDLSKDRPSPWTLERD